jgi:hypothetical protein
MSDEYTPPPWTVSADGFEIRAKLHDCPMDCSSAIAEMIDKHIDADEAMGNARRIAAAVNATKDFAIDGLEQIAERGLGLELALQASLLLNNAVKGEQVSERVLQERLKQLLEGTGLAKNTNEEQGERYPLSRGD